MTNQLVRVQVYLEPQNLTIIDNIAREENISRSEVIREAIEKHANRLTKGKRSKRSKHKKSILMEMAGIEVSKTGTVGLNVDEIYLED